MRLASSSPVKRGGVKIFGVKIFSVNRGGEQRWCEQLASSSPEKRGREAV
jgi:hypothetical protein